MGFFETGSIEGRSTVRKLRTDLNTVLTHLSPKSRQFGGGALLPLLNAVWASMPFLQNSTLTFLLPRTAYPKGRTCKTVIKGHDANTPRGIVYILKNRTESININKKNRLHPFYMIYIAENGDIIHNHLAPKEILNALRTLCKGKSDPIEALYTPFNEETKDGQNMSSLSHLLGKAIAPIIDVKEQSAIQGFLSGGSVSFVHDTIQGLDDFELVCFLVVK